MALEHTQQLVLDALRHFVMRGNDHPPAVRLAERAGLNVRTVYRALDDLQAAGRIRHVDRWEIRR